MTHSMGRNFSHPPSGLGFSRQVPPGFVSPADDRLGGEIFWRPFPYVTAFSPVLAVALPNAYANAPGRTQNEEYLTLH